MSANSRAGGMMLIAAGAVEHAQLVDSAGSLFQRLALGDGPEAAASRFQSSEIRDDQDLEQAHLAFAFPGVSSTDPDAVTAQVFATALGGGMSSRLFQEAREKRGLCYAIYAFSQSHRDAGVIGIYAGTGEDKAGEVTPLIAAEIEAMAKGATEEEAARARAQLRASLLMALESPGSRCERIAGHLFNFGRVLSTKEMTARVDAVDAAALRRFATRLLEMGTPAMASVGPVGRLETLDRFARRFGRIAALASA
jgi:predicted Zn-dependent peptidase